MYGLDSPEGQGVMGGYITGTLLGTIFNGLMASLFCSLGFFHPYSLAIGAAVGSSSMMAACMGAIVEAYPQYADPDSGVHRRRTGNWQCHRHVCHLVPGPAFG